MFRDVFAFELRQQIKSPVFWVVAVAFFLLSFGGTTVDQIHIGDSANVHKNSPYAIAQITLVWNVFFMFVTTAFAANVIVKDEETGFGPIVRSTRISKFDYLIGRFLGAYAASALVALAVPLAIMIGAAMPWLDPDTVGRFSLWPYVYSYLVLALPSLFLTAAAFFALATATRSMMATYVGVVAFFVAWFVASLWSDKPELEKLVALLEPFGSGAYGLATKYWTASERNTLTPALTGFMLWNRLLVIAVGGGLLALAYCRFSFEGRRWVWPWRRRRAAAPAAASAPVEAPPPPLAGRPRPSFGWRTAFAQLAARTRFDMGQVFKSPAFIVLLALGIINAAANLWLIDEIYGAAIHPVTRVMIEGLRGGFSIFPIIIAVYYAGELVWRERDRRTHEIVDSTPIPDWAFVAPKILAITLVLISTLLASVLAAILVQALKGYFDFEIGKYLLWYVVPLSITFLQVAVLAVFLQAIAPHKFVGWGLMLLYVVSLFVLPNVGLEHHLYRYGGAPDVPLSDMNGRGRFWIGQAWFELYWTAFALVLSVLTYALWRRGAETRFLPRLKALPRRLVSPAGALAALALVVFAGSGAYIFVNTNVWNHYRSQDDEDRWLADYEKTLLKYESVPQPKIVDVKLDVDIQPGGPRVDTRGVYTIQNKTGEPLREIHVRYPRDLIMRSLSIEGARPKTTYDRFNYRIFVFDTPMQPGETRKLAFETVLYERGFRNERNLTSVVRNGTFLNDRDITPSIGMSRRGLLQDRRKRAKYGLPRELRMPRLGAAGADEFNYLGHDADWVTADIRVTTDADQTPIAPGQKVFESVSGGRRTVEFRTTAPILKFFSIQSARYAVKRETYKGIDLAVYYDPQHPWNVGRMMAAMKRSLDYYQANFSPYQFKQLRFLEFPVFDGTFAQSFANTVPWSEDLGFIAAAPSDASKIDYVTYVGAHEIAHQWWAHQIIGADEQGATALSETLAQYSALMVMKHLYGPDMIRRFLKYELDRYLRARGGDVLPEQPLAKVEDQPYIHYNKGSLVMYRLQDEIGEGRVDEALRRLLRLYAFKGPPYPTTVDLVTVLRSVTPADKQQLITDLFEKITIYDVKALKASAKRRPDGRYDVTLTVSAKKFYADGKGKETEAPMNETVDVGLFTAEPGDKAFDPSKVVLMTKLPIRSGVQTLHLVADRAPRYAGVDPYNELIDRNGDDNLVKVGG